MRGVLLGMTGAIAASVTAAWGQAGDGPAPRLASVRVATGLTRPVFACAPPGDRSRLVICELNRDFSTPALADIKILNLTTGLLNPVPFLTIQIAAGGEGGLLGMAFDPAYAQNGRLYLHHTQYSPRGSRIVRYNVSGDPDLGDPASETEVLFAAQSGGNHQGGWLEFGPDGYLYFSIGDVRASANSQILLNLFGKISRIGVQQLPYTIPASNPFAGSTTARREILAYGLRNPFRCSLDRGTGDLWIGDVGEIKYEEINYLANPGAGVPVAPNFGWPCADGPQNGCPPGTAVVPPLYYFTRSPKVTAYVIGGCVYRGAAVPELRGTYFFWERGVDEVWSLRLQGNTYTQLTDRTAELTPPTGPLSYIVAFGQDDAGEMYLPSLTTGDVFKIIPRCWANCDGSTTAPVLDAADLACFAGLFATKDPYANCDGSTTPPVLNVQDFMCYLNRIAVGCD